MKQGLRILADNAAAGVADGDVRDHTVVRVVDEVIIDLLGRPRSPPGFVPSLRQLSPIIDTESLTLQPGTRVGPYEILSPLGAGGMGEVYRARDPKLHREVAIKVLPEAFADDPGRLARFQREAHVLASLNHPHIAAIYGLEEPAGTTPAFLVMELVEGEDLSQRIARGAIPLDEVLPIAKQIAEALEAAHEQGIIHRDLKPANIKVREDGTVKVLDFGLAKAIEASGSGRQAPGELSQSPTITTPAMMTGVGVILGTAAYMAPEQARGKPADKRSDIWAFGCVLYEMLTGIRAFRGEDVADTLAAVLRAEPDWNALPSDLPAAIRILLQRCLAKDGRKRVADIAAVLFVLDHQSDVVATSTASAAPRRRGPLWRRIAAMTAGALVVAVLGAAPVWFATRPAPPPVQRFAITPGVTAALTIGVERNLAITPDGTRLVYVANNGRQLLVRSFDQLEPRAIVTRGGLRGVFVSPDGQWVGFAETGSALAKVATSGGPITSVAQMDSTSRGATWAPDDTIIFATTSPATGLLRVSSVGGALTVLTTPDRARGEGDHYWPELLPGGQAVLFTITAPDGLIENAQIALLDIQAGTWRVLVRGGSHAYYVPTGHLVYGAAGTLRAVAFNLARREVVGTPAPVLEGVLTTPMGAVDAAVAANGSLVYIPIGAGDGGPQTVVLVDRQGRASPLPGLPIDVYRDVRISPDGARLALATQNDIWIYDFTRTTLSRLTTDPAPDYSPLWTADGQRIVFTSRRAGYPELWWRPADSTGSDQRFLARAKDLTDLRANGWSPDGSQLLFTEVSTATAVGQIAIDRPFDAKVLAKGDTPLAVSPDGHWMAYQSNVSGRAEVYVERYPQLGDRQQISIGGGARPLWSRDGRELFFASPDGRQMLAADVQSGTTLVAGRPRVLFESPMLVPVRGNRPYDLGPDGRFVIIRSAQPDAGGGPTSHIVLVQNWFEELKRLVPVN